MRKMTTYLGMAALAAGMLVTPVLADMNESDAKFSLHGEVRARGEYLNNLFDFVDHTNTTTFNDDEFDIWPYRVRIGAYGQFSDNVRGVVEIQNASFFGNNFIGAEQSPGDPLFQLTRFNFGTSETVIYQGYIEISNIGDSIMSAKIGRQEHTMGNELMLGDLDWYNGTSFDGIRLTWDFEKFNLDGFYYKLQEGNALTVSGIDSDTDFYGVTANIPIMDNGQYIEPYLLNYHDSGSPTLTPLKGFSAQFFTIGALYARPVNSTDDVDTLAFDWSIEAAFQDGDACGFGTSCSGPAEGSIGGSIIEGWFGYNWNHGSDSRSRVHIGVLMASGDDNPTDSDLDAFFPLFPDNHASNRLGDLDAFASLSSSGLPNGASGISNVTDINVGYEAWLKEGKHGFLAAIHMLTATEELCFGGGGLPACAGGVLEDDLGMEIDVRYNYNYSANLGFEAGIANVLAGDAVDLAVGPVGADDAMRVWGQARLRW